MEPPSPARLFALVVGGALAVLGVVGFLFGSSFETGDDLVADELLGIFLVNGWHNLLHLATGLLGLAIATRAPRTYALGAGALYVLLGVWGFIAIDEGVGTLLDAIPVDTQDNLLHLLIGLTGLAAGAASLGAED